jgi:hypothetical protein
MVYAFDFIEILKFPRQRKNRRGNACCMIHQREERAPENPRRFRGVPAPAMIFPLHKHDFIRYFVKNNGSTN